MIEEWCLAQFKSVGEETALQLRPLTILAGPNSSGKSTLLQSMLLVHQTLASRVSQRQIILNGELLKLGAFSDVLTSEAKRPEIKIGFVIKEDLSKRERDWRSISSARRYYYYGEFPYTGKFAIELVFGPKQETGEETVSKSLNLQGQLQRASFAAAFDPITPGVAGHPPFLDAGSRNMLVRRRTNEERVAVAETIGAIPGRDISEREDLDYEVRYSPDEAAWDSRFYPGRQSSPYLDNARVIGARLEHFLPGHSICHYSQGRRKIVEYLWELAERPDRRTSAAQDEVQKAVHVVLRRQTEPEVKTFFEQLRRLRQHHYERSADQQASTAVKLFVDTVNALLPAPIRSASGVDYLPPPDFIAVLTSTVDGVFSTLRYLGPLRDDPRALYGIPSSADPTHVGYKGEYTAAVLDLYGDSIVDPIFPAGTTRETRTTLKEAVRAWLRYFGIADMCYTQEEGKLGHRLYIRSSNINKDLDLTNVGVGVSQVLPIVVMALISAPGATLLFEQPELHLHPKIQSLLADFFLSVMASGRQCIVETHSEYLVNRLRLRVAESPWGSPLKDRIMTYFVEQPGSNSNFHPVTINDFGAVPDWPEGFFDQGPSESDRILQAAAKKRKTQVVKR